MSNKKNSSGAEQIFWDLSDLYSAPNDPKLKDDKAVLLSKTQAFRDAYKEKVADLDANALSKALTDYETILDIIQKMGSYAYLNWSTNTEDAELGKLLQEMNEFSSELSQQLVFFDLEWLKVEDDQAQKLYDSEELAHYRHYLKSARKYKDHMLSEEQEQLLSAKSVTGKSAWVRYFDETLGAARFDFRGESVTEQEVLSKLSDPDRAIRKDAAESLTKGLKELSRSLTFIFNTLLFDKSTNDKFRNYPDWITSRNLSNEIKDETVEALVQAVKDGYPIVQRYYKLKARLLKLDKLYDYDRYAPIMKSEAQIQWSEAKQMVLDAYTEFDEGMGQITAKFFDNNWIDAAIRPGKRGGAYSASTAVSVHPYVFMNYDGKIRDVQTLAHELGHGVHQYLSAQQGVLQSGTPLTTAETASVFGEMLVFQRLKKNLNSDKEKLALLIGKIDDTIATVFRQISMNRFEDAIHKARREQGELTKEGFGKLWMQTQTELYGDSVQLTENYASWWSYIPHFLHSPGYVYAYAFGELLVLALYEKYLEKPEGFSENYIEILKAGGSDLPENIVSKAGVDINSPDFWSKGIKSIELMIDEAEQLAKALNFEVN